MPQPTTTRDQASTNQKLGYLDQLAQSMIGLQSSNQNLRARIEYADAHEARLIDIQIGINNSEWAKLSAAHILYYTTNVQFNPPTQDDLDHLREVVEYLNGVNVSKETADTINVATVKLVEAFNASQACVVAYPS